MSGHSKWATTKHKKAVIDARRGKMFAKLIKNIEVAARMGGGDVAGNPTLYDAIQKAKKSSVPNDNIDRAVKRGSGAEAGGAEYTTIMYEGYGPNGVAFLIECLTDNRNRAAMEVRTAMTRNGGSLADPGSVSYMFNRKGVVIVPTDQEGKSVGEDDVLEATLEAGAEDVNDLEESFEVICESGDLVAVRSALQAAGIDYDSAEAEFRPDMEVALDRDDHDALAVEHVGHRAGVGEGAAVAGHRGPNLHGRAVAVVGQALDQERDAVGAVALVHDRAVVGAARLGTRAALDGPVDVVVRDRRLLRLLDGVVQGRVARQVAPTHPRRDLDVLDQLGEHLSAASVDDGLLVLGRRPLRMARHLCSSSW